MSNSTKSAKDILAARMANLPKNDPEQGEVRDPEQMDLLDPNNAPFYFVVDDCDVQLKSSMPTMEHPFFALRAGDTHDRHYEHNGNTIDIMPTSAGIATIQDKDVWIYCLSSIMNAINRGERVGRVVRFTAYDFLKATGRQTSGEAYKLLRETFERLVGTRIRTNIAVGKYRETRNFGLLEEYHIVENDKDERMVAVEVILPNWLYHAIVYKQVKTLSPAYFDLKPLERRIYELCAKHCGEQRSWVVAISTLHIKSGSTGELREFRRKLKVLIADNNLPDYHLSYDAAKDQLKVRNKAFKPKRLRT